MVDIIPIPVLEECVKAVRQNATKREEIRLRALLELYQDMPLRILLKELNDPDSYPRLEEVRRCSNKELTVTRELLERESSESERKSDARDAEVLPICVRGSGVGNNPQFLGGESAEIGNDNV